MTTTFENAKVGDRVWSVTSGWGFIDDIHYRCKYPIHVTFDDDRFSSFMVDGRNYKDHLNQELFWDEIKFEVPVQPPRMKLIHGVEVPNISFVPKEDEYYYYPSIEMPAFYGFTYFDTTNINDILKNKHGLCYPYTEQGKQAAILHAKAMLGVRE